MNEVRLRFIVPNFLGELYTNTSKLLEKIKEETGASEIEHTLIDQSGKLNIPRDSGYQAAVGWIEDGGGSWIIKKKTSKGKKKSVSSKQSLTIFEKEISFENITVDQIAELISEFNIGDHQINRNKDEKGNE